VCVCSLRYPACNTHAPYCHLWSVRWYSIFTHYLKNSAIFEEIKSIEQKCVVLDFPTNLRKTFLTLRSIQPDITINVRTSSCEVPLLLLGLNVTIIFWSDFRKILECQFHDNPSNGSPLVPSGRTDRQT